MNKRIMTATAAALLLGVAPPAFAKTAAQCEAEFDAHKAALTGVEAKATFMTACRTDTESIPGVNAKPAPAGPVPASAGTAMPAAPSPNK